MTELARQFLSDVLEDLKSKRLVLPTLPEVALRIRDVVEDADASLSDLVQIIATDAALSARLIQVANSPLLRAGRPIETLDAAITRLGMKMVRDLSTAMVVKQMFQPTSELTDKKLRQLWEHSVSVAAISHVLATQFTCLSPAQAMLAGLVHDIGALPVLTKAEDFPDLLEDEAALDSVLRQTHTQIGAAILASWNFPIELVSVAAEHENLSYDAAVADYVAVVIVANLQSYVGTDHPLASEEWSRVPAFAKLGLSPELNVIEIKETANDIREAERLLRG